MIHLDKITVQHSHNCEKCGNKKAHIRNVNKRFDNFEQLEYYRKGSKIKAF